MTNEQTLALAKQFTEEHYNKPTRQEYLLVEAAMRTAIVAFIKANFTGLANTESKLSDIAGNHGADRIVEVDLSQAPEIG